MNLKDSDNLVFPENIMIQTTAYCNANCIFCPYKEVSNEFPQGNMDKKVFKKIIDECSKNEDIDRIMPYLMNEPLLDKTIVEKINYAKEKNPKSRVHILTNGSLLTEELADNLINSKLNWIGISIHGIRKKSIRDTMGVTPILTLDRICNFIEKVKNSGIRKIEDFVMITFLNHRNLSEKEKNEAFTFWEDKGISRISYFEGPISRAGNVKDLPKVKNYSIKDCNSIWAKKMIHILYNGDVVLCCMDWRREVMLGNVKKDSIYDIWNGSKYKKIRNIIKGKKELPEGFLCSRCEAAEKNNNLKK